MLKRIKIPLFLLASIALYWFFFSGNEDPLPKMQYTIKHYHEDGCVTFRELGDFAAKRKDYNQAQEFYKKALSYRPDDLTAQDRLKVIQEKKKTAVTKNKS